MEYLACVAAGGGSHLSPIPFLGSRDGTLDGMTRNLKGLTTEARGGGARNHNIYDTQ